MRPFLSILTVQSLIFGLLATPGTAIAQSVTDTAGPITPIQHLVVIFQENVSFDHYFATYPNAANPEGQPAFIAKPNTPSVNGLSAGLLMSNPNTNAGTNGTNAMNPFRLDRSEAATADQNHNYGPEQAALHGGLVDSYPANVGVAGTAGNTPNGPILGTPGVNMGYYDGNTVTAMWNYAQHYAMSDNSFDTNFGPSTPGALNLISGQLNGVIGNINGTSAVTDAGDGTVTDIGDADPLNDVCSTTTGELFSMSGTNIGDLMNAKGVTWGFFTQGFDLTVTNANGTTGCKRSTTSLITNTAKADYIPHHEPFQYYKSTANPTHARPSSVAAIGTTDAANHQYDMHDFYDALKAGNLPSVNYLKAPGFQDGHAGYSDPLDEQAFIVHVINLIQNSPYWNNTAIVIAYDDSDGWYDHQMPPIMNQSASPADVPGFCGTGANALAGVSGTGHAQGRCGYGPRLPLLVISPWSKPNFVDHTLTDQTSILRFVEDNWLNGQRITNGSFDAMANSIQSMMDFTTPRAAGVVLLDESSGLVVSDGQSDATTTAKSGKNK